MNACIPLPSGLRLLHSVAEPEKSCLVMRIAPVTCSAQCPICHHPSRRVHSRYERTLADLPAAEQRVRLKILVRRFFCRNPRCSRRIFAERLPGVAAEYARRTQRLCHTQTQIAQAVGSRPGSRLTRDLAMPTSATTLLRMERSAPLPEVVTPRVLGVDDWAFRKGERYGTLLVDLERHRVVDLLPDRLAQSLSTWLRAHPGVEIISRDRAGAYAEGARQGAPQAQQVADRFHLLHNAIEVLQRLLGRHHRQLHEAMSRVQSQLTPQATQIQECVEAVEGKTRVQQDKAHRRDKRLAHYQHVVALHHQGASLSAIAETLRMSRHTVRRFLRADVFPERSACPRRPNQLEAFAGYLRQRWEQGCHNAAQLYREIQAQGFVGSASALRPALALWRTCPPVELGRRRGHLLNRSAPRAVPSPRATAWLVLDQKPHRDPEQRAFHQAFVEELCQGCEEVKVAKVLIQEFFRIVGERCANAFEPWMRAVAESQIPEWMGFSSGLAQDRDAVVASLSTEVSNGQTEGQVNRLKFIKRRGFGRANFDLLRQRVLHPT